MPKNTKKSESEVSVSASSHTEEKVDIAIISALCKLEICDIEAIVKVLFAEELKEKNKYMEAVEKFGDIEALWRLIEKYYGFNLEDKSLEKLMIFLEPPFVKEIKKV